MVVAPDRGNGTLPAPLSVWPGISFALYEGFGRQSFRHHYQVGPFHVAVILIPVPGRAFKTSRLQTFAIDDQSAPFPVEQLYGGTRPVQKDKYLPTERVPSHT